VDRRSFEKDESLIELMKCRFGCHCRTVHDGRCGERMIADGLLVFYMDKQGVGGG
jgi:hypothetical protein